MITTIPPLYSELAGLSMHFAHCTCQGCILSQTHCLVNGYAALIDGLMTSGRKWDCWAEYHSKEIGLETLRIGLAMNCCDCCCPLHHRWIAVEWEPSYWAPQTASQCKPECTARVVLENQVPEAKRFRNCSGDWGGSPAPIVRKRGGADENKNKTMTVSSESTHEAIDSQVG